MARPLRIEFAGAWYHVMNRGAGRQRIFETDVQRKYFLSLLEQTHHRFDADWHAYCLMDNHYHLMLRTPAGNLQRIMRHLNGVYTQYFNRTENTDGPLFRGRYKAILVDAEAYWLELSRYIHRNPLEAGRVDDLEEYPWSSYPAYVRARLNPDWLSTDYILGTIGTGNPRAAYRRFAARQTDDELAHLYAGSKMSPILGPKAFRRQVLQDRTRNIDQPELKRARAFPSIDEIVSAAALIYEVSENEILQSRCGRAVVSPARSVAMYLSQEVGGAILSDIAEHFGLSSYASAASAIRNVRLRLDTDRGLADIVNLIKLDLTP